MKNSKTLYRDFLAKHNLKSTKQRTLIFKTFIKTRKHVSAEQFCTIIKKIDSSIGQATIYRMLKLLVDSGIASKLEMGNGVPVYELNIDQDHHDHLICENCHKCIEFNDDRIEELQVKLAESYGFKLTSHQMYLYGLCPDCKEK